MPTINTKINSMYPPDSPGGVRAYASATIDGCLAIQGIRVMEGRQGLFVSMPSRKVGDSYREICFPVTKEFREQLHESVLNAYQQAMTQNQTAAQQQTGQMEQREPMTQTEPLQAQTEMQMGSM